MKRQKITEYNAGFCRLEQTVVCPVCDGVLNLRGVNRPEEGLAYFDPYNTQLQFHKEIKGAYTHHKCLSLKRRQEIQKTIDQEDGDKQ